MYEEVGKEESTLIFALDNQGKRMAKGENTNLQLKAMWVEVSNRI